MKKRVSSAIFLAVTLAISIYNQQLTSKYTADKNQLYDSKSSKENTLQVNVACNNSAIVDAYSNNTSDLQVMGCGQVVKVLPDDIKGSKHQKLIVALSGIGANKLTVLIAHNIDLAPRAEPVSKGTKVKFYGEYEYNQRGGVVHWTHHDPSERHEGGWLEVAGKRFE